MAKVLNQSIGLRYQADAYQIVPALNLPVEDYRRIPWEKFLWLMSMLLKFIAGC